MSMKQLAQELASKGRNGDTILAHITPEEAALLKSRGGAGTRNPETGLLEFNFFSDLWKGFKKLVKAAAPILLPAVAIFAPALIPAIGTTLGASAALAPIVGSMALTAGVTALSGGSISDVLSSAALAGLGNYLSPIIGDFVGSKVGITSATLKSVIGSAGFSAGMTTLRGGTVSQILTAAATGGVANYLGQIASTAVNGKGITNNKITQKTFEDAVFAAADAEQLAQQGLSRSQIETVLKSSGLSNSVAATAAAEAAAGTSAADIAVKLSNTHAGTRAAGSKEPSFYNSDATGASNSVVGGSSVKSLEAVQRVEDAAFVMKDAESLRDAGLNRTAIEQNLRAAGVDADLARNAADLATRSVKTQDGVDSLVKQATTSNKATIYGAPTGVTGNKGGTLAARELGGDAVQEVNAQGRAIAGSATGPTAESVMAGYEPSATPSGDALADAEFILADARQLAEQGLTRSQIESTLKAAGVSDSVASSAARSPAVVSGGNITSAAQNLAKVAARTPLFKGVDYSSAPAAAPAAEPAAPAGPSRAETAAQQQAAADAAYQTAMARGPVTNPDTLAADIDFAIADAQQLQAQGLGRDQIRDVLTASGMNNNAATYLAKEVVYGTSETFLRNDLKSMGTRGDLYQTVTQVRPDDLAAETGQGESAAAAVEPTAPARPVAPTLQSSTATATGDALLDAEFVAQDVENLRAAGLRPTQIRDTLVAAGVDPTIAQTAANSAQLGPDVVLQRITGLSNQRGYDIFPGYTPPPPPQSSTSQGGAYRDADGNFRIDIDGVGSIPDTELPPVTVTANPADVTDAEFLAYDAQQLAQQGLGEDAIRQNLIYSGADPFAATQAAAAAFAGADLAAIMSAGTGAAGGEDIYTATPPTTPVRNPAQVTDAEFVGFDAEQLAQQGLSQSQIESTLLYSGVDPLVAADAAALATAGYNAATIAQNIEQSGTFVDPVTGNTVTEIFTPGNAPAAALPGYQGPPGSEPGTAVNPTVPVAMEATPEAVTTPEDSVAALTPEQVGTIIATDQTVQGAQTQPPATAPYGSFTPAAPDPSWSIPLAYPGMNPGFMLAGVQPAYQTTSPVQSQYYWGSQPFMQTTADLANYNQVPMPAQPFGLQQGFFETPQPYGAGVPVYDQNMFPVAPATRMAPQAGVYNLPEPAMMQNTQQPYSGLPPLQNTQYPQPTAQPGTFSAVPMSAYQLPTQPGYIYDISPRADQYAQGFQPIAPTPVAQ